MKNKLITTLSLITIALFLCSCSNHVDYSDQQDYAEDDVDINTESISESNPEEINPIDNFVEEFNANCETELIYVEDFTPSDNSSSHYRTEFRLNDYSEAIAKSYSFEDATVDIVYRESYFGDEYIRVYVDGATFEQCETIIRIASPLLDNSITDEVIDETIEYVNGNVIAGHREANGYYYSELGLVLFEGDDECTMMLKKKNG